MEWRTGPTVGDIRGKSLNFWAAKHHGHLSHGWYNVEETRCLFKAQQKNTRSERICGRLETRKVSSNVDASLAHAAARESFPNNEKPTDGPSSDEAHYDVLKTVGEMGVTAENAG